MDPKNLFVLNGEKMKFYMPLCSERELVKNAIEESGGIFDCNGIEKDVNHLLHPDAIRAKGSTDDPIKYYDYRYIFDSIDAKKVLDLKEYEVIPSFKKLAPRKLPYTLKEDKMILNYICIHKRFRDIKGNKLYQEMEYRKICPERTYQSMKERLLKSILPNLNQYAIDQKFKTILIQHLNGTAPPEEEENSYFAFLKNQSKAEREQLKRLNEEKEVDEDSQESTVTDFSEGETDQVQSPIAGSSKDSTGRCKNISDDDIDTPAKPCKEPNNDTRNQNVVDMDSQEISVTISSENGEDATERMENTTMGCSSCHREDFDSQLPRKDKSRKRLKPYTRKEDTAILDAIIANNAHTLVKGVAIWQDLEESGVVKRTWQSMKERFRKRIVPNIHKFNISYKDAKLIVRFSHLESSKKSAMLKKLKEKKDSFGCNETENEEVEEDEDEDEQQ